MARPLRYTFILALVAAGAMLAAVGGWRYARASAPVNGPIILVSIDSLRADRLPAYGYRQGSTPAIDALARDGVVFERAYSHAPLTLPAHASMLSGRLPFDTGVRDNAGFAVADDERLIAEMLRDRGYATAGIVSSYVLRRETGIGQGFTFFDDDLPRDADTPAGRLYRDGVESVRVAEHWFGSNGTSRAFLFLHLYAPRVETPADPDGARAATEPDSYDARVSAIDNAVGRLAKYLKANQLYDQSTIVFVADHGEGLGEHGEQAHGLLVYEEALRIPFIIKPPAGEGAGRRVDDLVQQVDLVPTILDLANAPVPDNLRGISLRPLLERDGAIEPRRIYSESLYARYRFGWSGLVSISDGRYRYIKAPREELYDLLRDPDERQNLAEVETRIVSSLRAELDRLLEGADLPASAAMLPEDNDRLTVLGHVGGPHAEAASAPADPAGKVAVVETWREAAAAAAAGGFDRAAAAYRRVAAAEPLNAAAHRHAAAALFELRRYDEARQHAARAAALLPVSDAAERAAAHRLLVRIALARRDVAGARIEAERAAAADPTEPIEAYVAARLLFDQRRYDAALPLFEAAIAATDEAQRPAIPDLYYYAAETLLRHDRVADAERAFLAELEAFPRHVKARGGLASLYHATERRQLAAAALTDLVRLSPTPEAYTLAARLWTAFGEPREAAAVRAEARRSAAASVSSVTSAGPH